MSENLKPKQKTNLINQDVDGESLILNNQGAEIHQLNEVASLIWSSCNGQNTLQGIAAILCEKYDVSETEALADVTLVINQFIEKELLE